jgi:hypothetical protein
MRRSASIMMCGLAMAVTGAVSAQQADRVSATLAGPGEIPAVSTPAQGSFNAQIHDGGWVDWTLTYSGLQADIAQSHIHVAQPFANGGIVVWLCKTTQTNAPAGTADCPAPRAGTVSGTFDASDVVAVTTQGFDAGDFQEVVDAMRSGLAYVNVHSAQSPGGEIRGQIKTGAGH